MKTVGNIVAYALVGAAHQPLCSASIGDDFAQTIISGGLMEHQADCKKRGIDFGACVVAEVVEVDAMGRAISASFTRLHPATLEEIGEPCETLAAVFAKPKPKEKE